MSIKLDSFGGNSARKFEASGFFRLERTPERWWFVDPEGSEFISIGLNHCDESNLKYPHNLDVWKQKYGGRNNWIKNGVVKDLKEWGFHTIGWTQEYVSGSGGTEPDWFGKPIDIGHSTASWTFADYELADMPYVIQIPVAPIEDWRSQPAFPDVFSRDFDEYSEYLARS